ncbi:MAG: hypothetical protein WDZ93_01390 [Candidatus Paceibacterota bacterium]
MKLSDLWNYGASAGQLFSNVHSAGALFNAVLGKDVPEDASATVKGVKGIIGRGDERAFEILLTQATGQRPNAREIVAGYRAWARLKGDSIEVRVANAWYETAFRNHFLNMGAGKGSKIGTETETETETDPVTKKKTVKVKQLDIYGPASNSSLTELVVFIDMIEAANTLEEGYKNVVRLTGIPTPPANAVKFYRKLKRTFQGEWETLEELDAWLKQQIDERKANRGTLRTTYDKIFSSER